MPVTLGLLGVEEAAKDVQSELPKTLVSSAKVWTLANVFLYNCPLEYRVLASNCVDLFWALLLSQTVAECNEEMEVCLVSKPDLSYMEALRGARANNVGIVSKSRLGPDL